MKRIISLMLCIVMLLWLLGCSNQANNEDELSTQGIGSNAKSMMWKLVKLEVSENLKQPDTAEFDDISTVKFYKITDDTYEVLGVVKGQNALGNMVSNNFCATVIVDSTGKPTIVSNVEFLGDTSLDERVKLNEQLETRMEVGQAYLTAAEFDEAIKNHPLYVNDTKYIDSSELSYSNNSMLQAILYNNSNVPIKNAVIGFVAWDKNKLPIKIKQYLSASDGSYLSKINYDTINLMPGAFYSGKEGNTYYGMSIDGSLDVSFLKAIVVSYEDFDGNSWENPLLLDFKNLYEEKRLIE